MNNKGFTLIEIVVSLAILSVLCITILPVYSLQLKQRANMNEERTAMALLNDEVRLFYVDGKAENKIVTKDNRSYEIKWSLQDYYYKVSIYWKNAQNRDREEALYAKR
ncbi:MAG: competence type IV pilus minor pilin ComGE [Bacillaceae bacterium]